MTENPPPITPLRVSVRSPTLKVVLALRVSGLLIVAAVPTDTLDAIAVPADAGRPKLLPPMAKSPAEEASLIWIVSPVRLARSLFGANAAAVPANPGVVVSKTSVSPELGAALSAQFPIALQELLVPPVQCSVAGVVRSSSGSTRSRKGVRGVVRPAADRRGRQPRNQ